MATSMILASPIAADTATGVTCGRTRVSRAANRPLKRRWNALQSARAQCRFRSIERLPEQREEAKHESSFILRWFGHEDSGGQREHSQAHGPCWQSAHSLARDEVLCPLRAQG